MPVGAKDYKQALRKFASGITVVTVAHGEERRGMTATSFASVSLHPPLVSVSLEKKSRTRALVLDKRIFAANILAADQENISRWFASPGEKPFDRIRYRAGLHGDPLLDGALSHIECRVAQVLESGDHDVVIGEVDASNGRDGPPLVYFDRNYRHLEEWAAG